MIFRVFIYLCVGILLVFVLYQMFFTGESFQWGRRKKNPIALIDDDVEDIENFSSWDQALEEAMNAGDYRQAVRVLYLQTIQQLQQKKLIQYQPEFTNVDFKKQLSGTNYHQAFTILTQYFDYIWYGNTMIDRQIFSFIEMRYRKFQSDIL
jgi:hypothetical protein